MSEVTGYSCISRHDVLDTLKVLRNKGISVYEYDKWILGLPSVNPQIIRCKDCKHRDPEDKKCDCGCWHFPFVTKDDDFCSYAEAKMEEGECNYE